MNLFNRMVTEALNNRPEFSPLRVVVEKELLHHDILRIMRDSGLLSDLTFIGGTAIRTCYGGVRLSEDLDFTGGKNFTRDILSDLGQLLIKNLFNKYGLKIEVSTPQKDNTNVNTWKIKVETRPELKNFPAQRINIDICSLPSYDKRFMMLLNPYNVDLGTSGLIIQVQSCEEIYADKLIAFALRPNRIKYRDLWDIIWMHGKGLSPNISLIPIKVKDRNYKMSEFLYFFNERLRILKENPQIIKEFKQEMLRFLPIKQINQVIEQENLWSFITYLIQDFANQIK